MRDTFKKLPEEKQKAILQAAADIFAQKGFFQANIADICELAGISNGALYKYFKNKKELFVDVFQYITAKMVSAFLSPAILEENDSFYDALHKLLEFAAQGLSKQGTVGETIRNNLAVYLDIGSHSMNDFASVVSREIEVESKKFWVKMIKKGKKFGEIDPGIDIDRASYLVDNNFMFYVFSFISEHYRQRFDGYLANENTSLTHSDRLAVVMDTIHFILRKNQQ